MIHTDDHPPPHVHVRAPGGEVKVMLDPLRVGGSRGVQVQEVVDAVRLVEANREHLLACWRRIHG
jgi:hypothetical protein